MNIVPSLIGKILVINDQLYSIIPANNNNQKCISIQNITNGLFLRHKNGKIIESPISDNLNSFPQDSSFIPEPRGEVFSLHCSNEGMEDNYICKNNINTLIVNPDLVEYLFRPTENIIEGFTDLIRPKDCFFIGKYLSCDNTDYLTVPGNDGNKDHISLINPSNGLYLRHVNGKIIESSSDLNSNFFNLDSSFQPQRKEFGIVLQCVNRSMEKFFCIKK